MESHVEPTADGARVTGRVLDELGVVRPLARLYPTNGTLRPCSATELFTSDPIDADERGEFCFEVPSLSPGELVLEVSSPYYETHLAHLSLDAGALATPRFRGAPSRLSRSSDVAESVEILLPATSEEEGGALILRAHCGEEQSLLGEREAHSGELVRFEVRGGLFPKVGPCRLEAEFGAAPHVRAASPWSVEVWDVVALELESVESRGDRNRLVLRARTSSGPAQSGVVEIREEKSELFLGSAEVKAGRAELELGAVESERAARAAFVSSSPYESAGAPLSLTLPPRASARLRWALHALVATAFFAWLFWRWRRGLRPERPDERIAPPGEASILAVERARGAIRGRVADAHTGEGLGRAQIELFSVQAAGRTLLEWTQTDHDGRFRLTTRYDGASFLRLRVESPSHMTLEARVSSAELTAHLTERRRASLQALIAWAREPGSFWRRQTPPTPHELARLAEREGEPERAAWAQRIELFAYGQKEPSEEEIRALEQASPEPAHVDGSKRPSL